MKVKTEDEHNFFQKIHKPREKAEMIRKKQSLSPLRQGQRLDATETKNHMKGLNTNHVIR